jgi:predicted kinase
VSDERGLLQERLAGMDSQARSYDAWGQGLYGQGATEATYAALREGAEARLAQGASVIVDASFREEARRREFLELALRHGAAPLFVEVRASAEVVAGRLAARQAKGGSISDGRPELAAVQAAAWEDAGPLLASHSLAVDGGAELGEKLGPVLARLEEMGHAA